MNTPGIDALAQDKGRIYVCLQKDMTNADYLKEFQGRVKTVEIYEQSIGKEPSLIKNNGNNHGPKQAN